MVQKPYTFHFRKDEATGEKRDSLDLLVAYSSDAELVEILQRDDTDNAKELVVSALDAIVNNQVRDLIKDDESFSQATLDALVSDGKIGIEYLASLPKATRSRVTNDDLANFGMAFVEVCIATESNPEQRIASERGAQVAAQVFADRLRSAAGKDDVLRKLQSMVEKFIAVAPDAVVSEHGEALNFIARELDKALTQEDIDLDALD